VVAARGVRAKRQGVGTTLRIASYNQLVGEMQTWRASRDLKALEAAKGSALVLPFVKGLRLSAQLIYILRRQLSETDLEVDWGHLLDDNEESCSPECDIIIHHKGHVEEWDGGERPVMHFKFVRRDRTVAVISCKSFARDVDAQYVQKLRPYVKHVFLFAECCAPDKVTTLQKKAKRAGYATFGYLYTFDEKHSECVLDEDGWLRFLDAVASKVKGSRSQKRAG
jgi:hypothetical protein